MNIQTSNFQINSQGHSEIIDITPQVISILEKSKFKEGQVLVFAKGSTTGLTTIEYEPGLVKKDLNEMLDQFAPYGKNYAHNQTWGDDNGGSHLRSSLIKTSLTIPFVEGKMCLGTWQQIVFIDFDTRPRNRTLVVQISGIK